MLISPEGIAQPRSQGSLLPAPWSEGGGGGLERTRGTRLGISTKKREGSHGSNKYIEAQMAPAHCKPHEHSAQQIGFDRELRQPGQRRRYKPRL